MALVPQELVSEYYQINKPEIRVEDSIHELLLREEIPNDLRAKLLSHLVPKYQKLMQPPPPKKLFDIPQDLLNTLNNEPQTSVSKESDKMLENEVSDIDYSPQLAKYLAYAVPKSRKRYILPILEKLKNINYTFNKEAELEVNGNPENKSNAIDLFSYLMRDLKANEFPPKGFNKFLKGVFESNTPLSWIGNKRVRDELSLSEVDPSFKKSSPSLSEETAESAQRINTLPEDSPHTSSVKTPKTHKKSKWIPWTE